ncbi:uncharacterized protein BCR38DRAFT_410123 [Pseudomassariella vexata]|uniref:Uncharacterized protein n=1 Tax=Pseudomassariella vexata TaxID=1141098 RepID=A0A1Y2DVJ8_9PEZI|nr:uncharacterized protein BCR38DRAFT_410123 [Pseudomassariella vexata]ORY63166.1 hypothetical protein BCR38DRAFT_410123 [Pseudomassariella vexata]
MEAYHPSPLQVVKTNSAKATANGSPQRSLSTGTDESSGSAPEQPGSSRQLTVVKKRANRTSQLYGSGDSEGGSFGSISSRIFTPERAATPFADITTPKPGQPPTSRRTSSYNLPRTLTPNLLTRLRSFSNGRILSNKTSKATCRHYDIRDRDSSGLSGSPRCSDSVSSENSVGDYDYTSSSTSSGSYDPEPFLPLGFDGFATNPYRLPSNSLSSIRESDGSILDPYLLVPHIAITPETKILEDGETTLWAAIEISGQLCRPHAVDHSRGITNANHSGQCFLPVHHCEAGLSRYGYLYDVTVEIFPRAESVIVDLVNDGSTRDISPGSSLLTLAHVRLNAAQPPQANKSSTSLSDDLFADLEYQLGSTRTEYMKVRVSYCHSGFPAFKNTSSQESGSTCQTRLETTSIGVIKRHNPASEWSPRPTPSPVSNSLFAIIASHWGPIRANDTMYRIVTTWSTPRKVANAINRKVDRSEDTIKPPDRTGTAPPLIVPRRKTSLRKASTDLGTDMDPARKIWTQMRRTSSGSRPAYFVSRVNRIPGSSTDSSMLSPQRTDLKSDVERQRDLIREMALHNKRSIGADSLRSLVPSPVDLGLDDKRETTNSEESNSMASNGNKREGRWSLNQWW